MTWDYSLILFFIVSSEVLLYSLAIFSLNILEGKTQINACSLFLLIIIVKFYGYVTIGVVKWIFQLNEYIGVKVLAKLIFNFEILWTETSGLFKI